MLQIITENILPGTIIITDEWRAYASALNNTTDFQHRTINHSYNFVDPDDVSIHTQNIEGFWSLTKRFLRNRQGINHDQHFEYLIQFIWKFKIQKNKSFNKLLL
ncbi:hypothetical protein DMUE_6098, partial [Dictyocoela muelleri]